MEITYPLALVVGIVLCLSGWILYWAGLHLTGAVAGAAFGLAASWLGMAVAGIEPGESRWILPLGGAVGFCLGIFFIRGLHRFFFFFLGSAVGLALGQAAFEWLRTGTTAFSDATALWHGVFIVVGTVVGGVAMARGSRWLVMGLTSLAGALLVSLAFRDPLALLAAPPLAIASFLLQTGLLKRLAPTPSRDEEDEDDE